MSTRVRLGLIGILALLVACTDTTPTATPTRTPSPPVGLKGSSSLGDPIGDVYLTVGKKLDRSADVRQIELTADGTNLMIIVRFAKPLQAIDHDLLACDVTLDTRERRLFYVVSLVRSLEYQPPTFWTLRGGRGAHPNDNRYPITVSADQMSARVPVRLLDGLPREFVWGARCRRDIQTQQHDNDAVTEDQIGNFDAAFKETT